MTFKSFFENMPQKKVVALSASALIFAAGWQLYSVIATKPQPAKVIPLVRTITVGEMSTITTDVYPGEVRGRYESNLAFQVAGKINNRYVNIGDKVTAGQVLMTINPKDIDQALAASQAQLASAIANQKLAADNAERFTKLYKGGAVSQAVYDQYQTQLDAANATLRQAQAQATVDLNKTEYTKLRSDANGVVANIIGEIGQVTAAGNPLVTVVQNGEREVQINVPESKLSALELGQMAFVNFWALPGAQAKGTISEIAPMSDTLTKTYRVRVAIKDMPAEAKLGMTAKVTFNNGKAEHFLLPATAIYQTDKQAKVWLVKDNKANLADISIAGYSDNNVIVASGLKAGDVVVTAGINKLVPDQSVRLMESGDSK
ncbi:MAG: efflux RND transporter periplasmic adaptor subunit [Phascolarctobacterium sp.]|nr:efflux RND transporter periplasmic adaptor subunit [Phascolarctobacterium sp.]